jgi:hypothetical protein
MRVLKQKLKLNPKPMLTHSQKLSQIPSQRVSLSQPRDSESVLD